MKVAVCISGQMRTFRQTSKSMMANLIHHLRADVFIHTWDKAGNTNKLILFLPRGFHLKLPFDFWHANPDLMADEVCQFEKHLPNLYNALQKVAGADEEIACSELLEIYNPLDAIVEPFDQGIFDKFLDLSRLRQAFSDATCLNAAPMFYKIDACDRLRRNYEKKSGIDYDIVVRTRPDLEFSSPLEISELNFTNKLYTLYNPFYDQLKITDTHSNDMFFIGDSASMTYATSIWEKLPALWDPNIDPDWPLSTRGPELIFNRHLRKNNLHGSVLNPTPLPHRVVLGVSFEKVIDLLRLDYEITDSLPDFIADCIGICQGTHAVDLFLIGKKDEAEALLEDSITIGDYQCAQPFGGRARIAQLKGEETAFREWSLAAKSADQHQAFPEIIEKT